MLIAGDIGGTKTDLAVYAKESGHLMARLPVHLITTQAALIGAAMYGLESMNGQ